MSLPNIAFAGRIGSGKTTCANILVDTEGYRALSFAGPLKKLVIEADPLVQFKPTIVIGNVSAVPIHLSDILKSGKTFEECKREYPEVRRALQRIGQGIRRIDPDYWVKNLLSRIVDTPAGTPIVIPDMRYPNEADALRKNGFKLVKISRPTIDLDDRPHESETALDGYGGFHHVLHNTAPMIDLITKVLDLL